jgi:hypothetical protein
VVPKARVLDVEGETETGPGKKILSLSDGAQPAATPSSHRPLTMCIALVRPTAALRHVESQLWESASCNEHQAGGFRHALALPRDWKDSSPIAVPPAPLTKLLPSPSLGLPRGHRSLANGCGVCVESSGRSRSQRGEYCIGEKMTSIRSTFLRRGHPSRTLFGASGDLAVWDA